MQTWDVIVVGAGPAGCAAAYDLATSGRSVLLLDCCDFPRRKACGGGVTMKAVRVLRYSIAPVVVATVYRTQVSKNFERSANLISSKPVCLMTVREEFDAFCLNQTIGAGAEFRKIAQIHGLRELPDVVVISTAVGDLQARFLVGADGANSQVRGLIGEARWFRAGFALEAQVASSQHVSDMHLDFGVVSDGYGWVFPKNEHLNVGLYSQAHQHKITRSTLAEYIQKKLGSYEAHCIIGQYLGMGGMCNQPNYRRVLLVGDAAGLVDPLTGEGIYHAIVSGQTAALAINSELKGGGAALEIFQRELREVAFDLEVSLRAAKRFYGDLDWGYDCLCSPLVRTVALQTYFKGLSFGRALKRYSFVLPYFSSGLESHS